MEMPSAKAHIPNGQNLAFEMASVLEDFRGCLNNNPIVLSQYHHEEFLRNRITKNYGCQVESGTELVSFEPDERGVVARLKKHHAHSSNAEEIVWTPYLVGADGGHSVVRKIAGLQDMKSEGPMLETFQLGRVFVAGGRLSFQSILINPHIDGPQFNLGWKLALVLKGLPSQSLLGTYCFERVLVVAAMLQKTNRLTGKITENIKTASPVSFVSDITYRGSRIIVDDYASAGEFVDFYGSGVDGSARAGDRAPDAPGLLTESGEVTTLFDSGVFASNAHTVITFAKEPPQKLLPVPNPGLVRVAIIVPQGSASEKHYRVKERDLKFLVVRPDGVIGALTKGIDGLKTYFRKIFV
ncbi:hypothetical protein CPB85DRAFT_1429195 [Mucidula mucida]|nr:hypothetical protein CPB85DRAFT_1429195 [Mucidula mucida]